jgi:GH35 family endo-1,4-beta-xylanase
MGSRSIDHGCCADEPTPRVARLWAAANAMTEWTFDQRLAWVEGQLKRKPKQDEAPALFPHTAQNRSVKP